MLKRRRKDDAVGNEAVELAALADGSVAPKRRAPLEARVAASPELADRLAEQQRALALAQSAAAEIQAPAALRARVEGQQRIRRGPTLRRPVVIGAAATAVTVVAVSVGLAVLDSGTAGKRFQAVLAPTELAPGAAGEASLTKTSSGWRIELDASGLPRLAHGRLYEAWLRNPAGVLVPVGTFNEGRKVTLWAGVSPKEFTTLTVTRERAGGDQASSGEQVLVGTVDSGRSG